MHIPINKYAQDHCKKRKLEPSEETNDLTIQTKSRASCPQPVINKGQPEPEGSKLNLYNKDLALETEDGPISSGKTQQQGKGLSSNPIVIDVSSPYPDYWINCNIDDGTTITLYAESKKRILQSNYWLADSEIYAGQKLLKKQHPFISGFHSASIRGNLVTPEPSEFIQIINMGGSHWVCLSTIGCPSGTVKLYNSIRSSCPNKVVLAHASRMLFTKEQSITFGIPPVQQQIAPNDLAFLHWLLQHHFVKGCLQKKGSMIKVYETALFGMFGTAYH